MRTSGNPTDTRAQIFIPGPPCRSKLPKPVVAQQVGLPRLVAADH